MDSSYPILRTVIIALSVYSFTHTIMATIEQTPVLPLVAWAVFDLFWNSKDSTSELSKEHNFPLSLPTPFSGFFQSQAEVG